MASGLTRAADAANPLDSLRRLPSERLMEMGREYFVQRQASKALACFTIVSERQGDDKDGQLMRIRALNNCACVYKFFYFDYTQAYDYFIRAYELCEQTRYADFEPVVMVNLGDLLNDYSVNYGSKELAQHAWDIFGKCIDKAVESKNWDLMATAFFNLANQNYELDLTKYRVLFSKEIPDTVADLQYVRLLYQGIGHIQQGRYTEARQCFERQLAAVSTPWEPERDTLATYMNIAYTYQQQQHYQQAIDYLLRALQLTEANQINDLSASICQQLSESYAQTGRQELADQYRVRYLESREAMMASKLANIAELNYIHELKKEEARARQLEQRQFQQQIALLAGLVVLAVGVVFTLLLWRKNRELRERNQSLYEKNRQVMKIEADEQRLLKVYSKSSLNDEQRETLIYRIKEVLNDSEEICQQDFTLSKLAKIINSNTTYVSQVINENYGMAFSNVLSSRRIKVACQWMDNPAQYGNLTIEAIASATGFKSRTTFVNAFKRETGLKPSEYLHLAVNKEG